MVKSKDMTAEEPEEIPVVEETAEVVTELADSLDVPAAAAPAPTGRRAPGTKEVVPFRWKLVGESCGMVLTLFKGAQREDVDAQHDRVRKEGYYTNLRVLDVNEKVTAPPVGKPSKAAKTAAPARSAKTPQHPTRVPKSESAGKAGRDTVKPRAATRAPRSKPAVSGAKRRRKAVDSKPARTKKRPAKKK